MFVCSMLKHDPWEYLLKFSRNCQNIDSVVFPFFLRKGKTSRVSLYCVSFASYSGSFCQITKEFISCVDSVFFCWTYVCLISVYFLSCTRCAYLWCQYQLLVFFTSRLWTLRVSISNMFFEKLSLPVNWLWNNTTWCVEQIYNHSTFLQHTRN